MKYSYFHGLESKDESKGKYYNPDMVQNAIKANKLVKDFIPVIKANLNQAQRASAVAWQLLELSTIHADKISLMTKYLAVGDIENAAGVIKELNDEMSKREVYFERYYDHYLFMRTVNSFISTSKLFDNATFA